MDEGRRLLYWEGSSKKEFDKFPVRVRKNMGVALYVAQLGGIPGAAKTWKGLGPGVYELVDDSHGNAFRAVYVVHIGQAVHVLHAFQKKSKSGIATPQCDVDVVVRRLKRVFARYPHGGRRNDSK